LSDEKILNKIMCSSKTVYLMTRWFYWSYNIIVFNYEYWVYLYDYYNNGSTNSLKTLWVVENFSATYNIRNKTIKTDQLKLLQTYC
jgi:hypothetical protein